ncbi:MAG TPA: hypothetical protein VGN37_23340 [Actinocatenispora sp.]
MPGSRFAINDTLIAEPGTGDRTKFFNSSADGAVDPDVPNNMSVDAKAFTVPHGVIPAGSTRATLTFSTSGDTYLAQQLAFSVPVPDIDITKTADVTHAAPGQRVTYTVTVRNVGGAAHPDVHYTDDLSDVLDDAAYRRRLLNSVYRGDAEADGGTVRYAGRVLSWSGAVPVGATYHVRYSVVVSDPPTGDRRMRNVLVTDDPAVSCPSGATDRAARSPSRYAGPRRPAAEAAAPCRAPAPGTRSSRSSASPSSPPAPPSPSRYAAAAPERARTGPYGRVAGGRTVARCTTGLLTPCVSWCPAARGRLWSHHGKGRAGAGHCSRGWRG